MTTLHSKAVQEVDKADIRRAKKRAYYHLHKILKNRNPDKRPRNIILWESNIKRKYNLTQSDYNDMLRKQNYSCDICGMDVDGKLFVDHNHVTGNVRGLLCRACNTGLGNFVDNEYLLLSAILYLQKEQEI